MTKGSMESQVSGEVKAVGKEKRKQYLLLVVLTVMVGLITQIAFTQSVDSIGEINAKDNSLGTVIAGREANLIMTLIADMSQAIPGEEIESIQITIPSGFTIKDGAVTAVRTSEKQISNFETIVDGNLITVVLPKLITLSTVVTIEFIVDAPPTPISNPEFIISLLNITKSPIIIAVKPGNADGRINNDSFFIYTAAATKPDPNKYPPWDVNKDGRTDIYDIVLIVQHLREDIAIPLEYNPDVNRDGIVNILDLVILCANYGTVSYSTDIQPIFTANCAFSGCHAAWAPSGLMLTSYAGLSKGGISGRAFVAGDSGNSLIVDRLKGRGAPRMPLAAGPLKNEYIQKIRDWIDNGGKDD